MIQAMDEQKVTSASESSPLISKANGSINKKVSSDDTSSIQSAPIDPEECEDNVEVNYDKKPLKMDHGKATPFGAVFVVTNAALGAGLLTFPYSFYLAGGWYWGIVTELILLPFIIGGLLILAYSAELCQTPTCEKTIGSMLGKFGQYITEVLVVLYCFGCCVTLMVVMGDQITDVVSAFNTTATTSQDRWYTNHKFLVPITSLVLVYPILYLKKIGFLSYTSFLGVTACVYICIVVVIKYFFDSNAKECLKKDDCFDASWMTAFNAIPFVCFGFQCHVSSIPVYSELRNRNMRKFFGIVLVSVSICMVLYTLTGVFGLLTFTDGCINSDLLRNYCPDDIPVGIARGMIFISLVTSYPILTFCGRVSIEGLLARIEPTIHRCFLKMSKNRKYTLRCSSCCCSYETIRQIIIINIWMFTSLALALFIPEIKKIISPLGSLAAVFIFVLPGLCLLKLSLQSHFRGKFCNFLAAVISCIFVCFGCFILGDDLTHNIMDDIVGD